MYLKLFLKIVVKYVHMTKIALQSFLSVQFSGTKYTYIILNVLTYSHYYHPSIEIFSILQN